MDKGMKTLDNQKNCDRILSVVQKQHLLTATPAYCTTLALPNINYRKDIAMFIFVDTLTIAFVVAIVLLALK